jgi:DinB family protein
MEDVLRYPIGKFDPSKASHTAEERKQLIDSIAELPASLQQAVAGLNGNQLDTAYREGGWSVRQVVHHLADAHINAYTRFKLGLTEDTPAVKPFDEAAWAELADSRITPVDASLALVENLHARWVALLRSLKPGDWERKVSHPQAGPMSLDLMLGLYEWHGRHHVAHIAGLRARNRW